MKLEETQKSKEKKIQEIKRTGDSLFVATPVHSGCDLHYMKSCLDLQKECLLHNVNITFQIIAGAFYTLVVYYVGTFNPNHFIMRDFSFFQLLLL